jgi:hypothetical protein
MRQSSKAIAMLGAALLCGAAAASKLETFPVDHALAPEAAAQKLRHSVRLFWGAQPYPQPERDVGSFRADEASNSTNKSDQDACDRALLSALIFLQASAEDHGANAVVAIHPISARQQPIPAGQYACDAGGIAARVMLRGRVVKLPASP